MRHFIKKQVIDLVLDSKLDPFTIQHRVSQYNQQKILPVLEKIFNDLFPGEQMVLLDKLEIDLGILAGKKIEQDNWEIKLESIIYEQVNKTLQGKTAKPIIQKESREIYLGRQWLYYMEHGYLPWNALALNPDDYAQILEVFAVDFKLVGELKRKIRMNLRLCERIVLQHPPSFLVALAELLSAKKQDKLLGLIDELYEVLLYLRADKIDVNEPNKTKFLQRIWKQILQLLSRENQLSTEVIADKLVSINFNIEEIIQISQSKTIFSKLELSGIVWKRDHTKLISFKEGSQAIVSGERKIPSHEKPNEIDEEGIFISNAGIVLLHPFLPSFFKLTDLTVDNRFRDMEGQQKALYILYFMATGRTDPEEHELVAAKLLTGYPLEEPVAKDVELKESELEEANHLLDVVISAWATLKNTSRNGLREGFLQRSGKLFYRNNNLYLQLEASSIDVLLDHLPWNLSMIKMPWMQEILRVEWR